MQAVDLFEAIKAHVERYGEGNRTIMYSLRAVKNEQEKTIRLQFELDGRHVDTIEVAPYSDKTIQQRANMITILDVLKAFAEVGNLMIREHNWDVYIKESKNE